MQKKAICDGVRLSKKEKAAYVKRQADTLSEVLRVLADNDPLICIGYSLYDPKQKSVTIQLQNR